MVKQPKHRIDYSPEAVDHLGGLPARQRARVVDQVDRRLTYEPTVPGRNRKVLRANVLAPYELRLGELRVYYDVVGLEAEAGPAVVVIVAIGVKVRDKVTIGGEEVEL